MSDLQEWIVTWAVIAGVAAIAISVAAGLPFLTWQMIAALLGGC